MKNKKILINILKIVFLIIALIYIFKPIAYCSGFNINAPTLAVNTNSGIYKYFEKILNAIAKIGSYVSVGALIVIGIKYMEGSSEEKAINKEMLINYFIGASMVFGISNILTTIFSFIKNLSSDATVEALGGRILYLMTYFSSFVSVIVLIFLGIKYMMGSTEQQAKYKQSLVPYVIGCVIVLGASKIASAIYGLYL